MATSSLLWNSGCAFCTLAFLVGDPKACESESLYPTPSILIFSGEDFLAGLFLVDAVPDFLVEECLLFSTLRASS